MWTRILAEGDSMWVDSTAMYFGRGEVSSYKFGRDGRVVSSRSSQYR